MNFFEWLLLSLFAIFFLLPAQIITFFFLPFPKMLPSLYKKEKTLRARFIYWLKDWGVFPAIILGID